LDEYTAKVVMKPIKIGEKVKKEGWEIRKSSERMDMIEYNICTYGIVVRKPLTCKLT
jgi:hypothetical protein